MHCDMHANSSPNLIILLSPSRDYNNMSLCSLYCAYCALKALVGKPTKKEIVWNYVQCSKQEVQKLQIAYFCGFLRIFADYLRTFASFLRTFCLWFGAFGDQNTAMFTIRRKSCMYFVIRGRSVGPCLNSGADEQEQYILCVCICSKKLQNMLVSLIHGTEFIDLTLKLVPQAILITHV